MQNYFLHCQIRCNCEQIHGDKDADGFYLGEVDGRYGLVPCNMVSEVHVDSPDVADRLLRDNPPTPPPGFSTVRTGGNRTPGGGASPRSTRPRQHRPGTIVIPMN